MVTEVTIAGGGPAGSALAIELGQRGVPVTLYEKTRHPRLKPCGEGLLPHGVAALEAITSLPPAPRIRGLRFVAGTTSIDADFPRGHGLVVRRDRLDAWLFALAAATPNVDVRPGRAYQRPRRGLVVGADGIHSRFHRVLQAVPVVPWRAGLSAHVSGIDGLQDQVEVYFHDGGELYIAPAGNGEVLVSALFDYRSFRRDGIPHLLQRTPALRERLGRIEYTTPVLAAAPLSLHVPRIVDHAAGLLLVGDAAGTPDPITAGGLSLAFAGTRPAADAIVTGSLDEYARQRLAMGRRAHGLARVLLALGHTEHRAAWWLRHFSAAIIPLLGAVVAARSTQNANAQCG